MPTILGLVFMLVWGISLESQGSTVDLPGGWLHSPASLVPVFSARGGDRTPGAEKGIYLAAGQTRLYGLQELPVKFLALGLLLPGTDFPLALKLNVQATGGDLVGDTLWGGELRVGQSWGLGVVWSRRCLQVGGWTAPPRQSVLLHAMRQGNFGQDMRARLDLYLPAVSCTQPNGIENGHRKILSVEVGRGPQSLALALERGRDDVPRLKFEVLLGLGSRFGILLHGDPATGVVGPGFCLARPGFLLMTSHLVHPVLGITHRVMLVLGNWHGCRL